MKTGKPFYFIAGVTSPLPTFFKIRPIDYFREWNRNFAVVEFTFQKLPQSYRSVKYPAFIQRGERTESNQGKTPAPSR